MINRKDPVLVTGSAGKLGRVVVECLTETGMDVVPSDKEPGEVAGLRIQAVDLSDSLGMKRLMEGIISVVHCGAVPGFVGRKPGEILGSNVEGTLRLCLASLEAGIENFVYASSIQVFASEGVSESDPSELPYLPLDGGCPPNPRNPYAFSKAVGEVLVRDLLGKAGIQSQSLRFPWLVKPTEDGDWGRKLNPHFSREKWAVIEQGFSFLSFRDAARLIDACLRSDLPGHRTYLPAITAVPSEEVPRFLSRYYGGIPLEGLPRKQESLIDLSRIEAETGWAPEDRPVTVLPEDLPKRALQSLRRVF